LDTLRAPVKKKRKLAELSCDALSWAGLMLCCANIQSDAPLVTKGTLR